jgi:hypothetical protein
MTRVGFIGLGNMGSGMAANLAAKGFDVAAFDLSAEALDRARAAGCGVAASAADAAASARVVVTMLPAGAHVATVWREALFPTAAPGTLLVDCSTIDVETARTLAAEAAGHGLLSVDAPVSGGIAAAAAGTLTFMVGGSEAAFLAARPGIARGPGVSGGVCNRLDAEGPEARHGRSRRFGRADADGRPRRRTLRSLRRGWPRRARLLRHYPEPAVNPFPSLPFTLLPG